MSDPYAVAKRAAGRAAADLIKNNSVVGLGTGSTVAFVLERIGERVAGGLALRGVPTSEDTANKARKLGVPLTTLDEVDGLDLTIDGADEIDTAHNMIKGGGGALLREKIVAAASSEMVVVVGRNKLVEKLGAFRVPVEIMPFGRRQVIAGVRRLGGEAALRRKGDEPYVTDSGHWILDCDFGLIEDPTALERDLDAIPGIVESGLFLGLAGRVFVGDLDGGFVVLP